MNKLKVHEKGEQLAPSTGQQRESGTAAQRKLNILIGKEKCDMKKKSGNRSGFVFAQLAQNLL